MVLEMSRFAKTAAFSTIGVTILMVLMSPMLDSGSFQSSGLCELGFAGYRFLECLCVTGLAWAFRGAESAVVPPPGRSCSPTSTVGRKSYRCPYSVD